MHKNPPPGVRVPCYCPSFGIRRSFLHRARVFQDQFRFDDPNVPHRIHGTIHAHHVVVEAPHHKHNRVHIAVTRKGLSSQAIPRAGPRIRPAMSRNSSMVAMIFSRLHREARRPVVHREPPPHIRPTVDSAGKSYTSSLRVPWPRAEVCAGLFARKFLRPTVAYLCRIVYIHTERP